MSAKNRLTQSTIKTKKIYDSVFWSSARMLPEYMPYLVNELFGLNFSDKARVKFKPGKLVVAKSDGTADEEYMDALFTITEKENGQDGFDIHIECETKGTKGIYLRIARYKAGYAYENVTEIREGAKITIPHSAVIFLRQDSTNMSSFLIVVECPRGEMSYFVPVLRIKDYTLDEIFEKKLLVLLPFYPFIYSGRDLRLINGSANKLKTMEETIMDINRRLSALVVREELTDDQRATIMQNLLMTFEKYANNYDKIRKDVTNMRKVKIIRTELDVAWAERDHEKEEKQKVIKELEKAKEENARLLKLKEENDRLREILLANNLITP